MWKCWRLSPADAPGDRLVACSLAVVAAVLAGNWWPPQPMLAWPLLGLAVASAWRGLAAPRGLLGWWWAVGALVGLAACALTPRVWVEPGRGGVPARVEFSVRDGWTAGPYGWRNRVRLHAASWRDQSISVGRDAALELDAPVGLAGLPSPGSRWTGAGELVGDREFPLRPPRLRVKTLLLLTQASKPVGVDALRQAAVWSLQAAAGADVTHLRAAGLAAALVLGRRDMLLAGDEQSLRRSGLVHLLSVSGLHVGLVGVLVWGAGTLLGVPPRPRRWMVCFALVGFAVLAGGFAPVRRAAFAGVAYLVARQLGRPLLPLPTVWAVVAVLLVAEPAAALDVGFQLSAVVTLALVRWSVPLAGAMAVLPVPLARLLGVAAVAQLASAPLVGASFAVVPPLGVIANVLAAPLELLLVGASAVAVALAPVWRAAAGWALEIVSWLQHLLRLASLAGSAASWAFAPLPVWLGVLLGISGAAALTRVRAAGIAALVAAASTVAWMAWPAPGPHRLNEVHLLAVRDGMALLARRASAAVLVDSGRDRADAWRELARLRVRRLSALMVTHPDVDHTGGAGMILELMPVGQLVFPRELAARSEIVTLRRLARVSGVRETPCAAGDAWSIEGIPSEVLWPPVEGGGGDNDSSLVAKLGIGGVRVLITGDIEAGGERRLLATGASLSCDVLQLPHHGSSTSSTSAFLAATRPVIAVAATGTQPRFAFPSPSVTARVRVLPAVMLAQGPGAPWLGWDGPTAVEVGRGTPVVVRLRGARGND